MAARLWTVLLLLAGIVAMHGLQCTPDSAHGLTAAPTQAHAEAAPLVAGGHMVAATASGLGDAMVSGPAVTDPHAAPTADAQRGSGPHGAAEHLWTLCLAVLAAGLAVLLAVLAPRLIGAAAAALRRARARAAGGLAPLRPPDLSALCLLRI